MQGEQNIIIFNFSRSSHFFTTEARLDGFIVHPFMKVLSFYMVLSTYLIMGIISIWTMARTLVATTRRHEFVGGQKSLVCSYLVTSRWLLCGLYWFPIRSIASRANSHDAQPFSQKDSVPIGDRQNNATTFGANQHSTDFHPRSQSSYFPKGPFLQQADDNSSSLFIRNIQNRQYRQTTQSLMNDQANSFKTSDPLVSSTAWDLLQHLESSTTDANEADSTCTLERRQDFLKQFAKAYASLPTLSSMKKNCQRTRILNYLGEENKDCVLSQAFLSQQPNEVESLFWFLVDLRQDLLSYMALCSDALTDSLPHFQKLDKTIVRIFATSFQVPHGLDLKLIDERYSSATLQRLVEYEAVHPIYSIEGLVPRLGPKHARRVYGLFHSSDPGRPLIVIYVALLPNGIPSKMDEILSVDQLPSSPPKVATFYSISNHCPALVGTGLGETLIERVATKMHQELPAVHTFCTLSPLPTFRKWLIRLLQDSNLSADTLPIPSREIIESLQNSLNIIREEDDTAACSKEDELNSVQPLDTLHSAILQLTNCESLSEITASGTPQSMALFNLYSTLEPWLQKAAAHYLAQSKDFLGRPVDPVTRFHVGNGAVLYQIHVGGDNSRYMWKQSWGVMVTYKYDLDQKAQNRELFVEHKIIPLGRQVKETLERIL